MRPHITGASSSMDDVFAHCRSGLHAVPLDDGGTDLSDEECHQLRWSLLHYNSQHRVVLY